jgi:hypothetical protein|uniref:Uncharacterized protein n=1 Tax=viral metagenome TaxID=1070528 RepID=A0A6C0JEF6_9ZZZZ
MLNYIKYILQIFADFGEYKWHRNAFNIIKYLSYIAYFSALFGIYSFAPKYSGILDLITRLYISLFLIIRFNPLVKEKYTKFDKNIVFSAGLFLFITTSITSIVKSY